MYGAITFATPSAGLGSASRDAHVFYLWATLNERGEHICRAENRTIAWIGFSAAGPASRDALVFLCRTHFMYEAINFAAPRAGLLWDRFFRRRAGEL